MIINALTGRPARICRGCQRRASGIAMNWTGSKTTGIESGSITLHPRGIPLVPAFNVVKSCLRDRGLIPGRLGLNAKHDSRTNQK